MKTNKFEENIRKKLESLDPKVSDTDWASFQKYSAQNLPARYTSPVWKRIGYGIAASTLFAIVGVCGLLYQQNQELQAEVATLKTAVKNLDHTEKVDRTEAIPIDENPGIPENTHPEIVNSDSFRSENLEVPYNSRNQNEKGHKFGKRFAESKGVADRPRQIQQSAIERNTTNNKKFIIASNLQSEANNTAGGNIPPAEENYSAVRVNWGIPADPINQGKKVVHIPNKKYQKNWNFRNSQIDFPATKTAKVAKPERALPTFITERPYRVGVSVSGTKRMHSIGFVNEFLVHRKVSLSWGISQTRFDEVRFFNEQVFAKETGQNFRKTFGGGIPYSSDIVNIKTQTTLFQLPVALSFRQAVSSGISLTAGLSTQLNLRFRQSLDYGFWDGYRAREISNLKYRKASYPLINNVSPVVGIEKRLDPLVFQGEVFYNFQKNDVPYLDVNRAFGARVKILYQIGK